MTVTIVVKHTMIRLKEIMAIIISVIIQLQPTGISFILLLCLSITETELLP